MQHLPTLRQLQFYEALCRTGSFSRAAEACFVSQSTLSSGIKELEATLDAVLVDRSAKGFALTPSGEEVRRRAEDLLADARELTVAASTAKPLLDGSYRFGLIPTIGPFLLPAAMPRMEGAFPELRAFLREDLTANLVELLRADQLDMAVLALPIEGDGLDCEVFAEDPFFLVCREDHPLAEREEIATEELLGEPLMLLEDGHCLRDHALSACRLPRPRDGSSFAATSLFTLVQMVRSGLGVTLLPKLAVGQGLADGLSVIPLKDPDGTSPSRSLGLAWRRSLRRREEAEALAPVLAAAVG
ncbi:hydrogen peroxide-inducible genes activator [Parvularcula sp. ZS-1/3]|uniref:Hydrogen peroxide-inducible genes activator n=1 Tax=Parvularcula mediterranea TaxID=2732508 RepID=A0A7Y3RPF5_9PROT|nr:hydrogen peroxide-inducible genes activator [Parvularcula mediterranea]NNU17291.1 hydrogen peroxide-inducible genes activator [Parvularcula mediterranea]